MGSSYQNKKTVNLNGLKLAYEMVWITKKRNLPSTWPLSGARILRLIEHFVHQNEIPVKHLIPNTVLKIL